MKENRFSIVFEPEAKQFAIFDHLENRVVVRYGTKKRAETVCKDLNTKLKE
jgi:hypothetical protein